MLPNVFASSIASHRLFEHVCEHAHELAYQTQACQTIKLFSSQNQVFTSKARTKTQIVDYQAFHEQGSSLNFTLSNFLRVKLEN